MKNHKTLYEYQDSKSFLVNAYNDTTDQSMWAWKNKDGCITSIRKSPHNSPEITVRSFKSLTAFRYQITWHDWIIEGVRDQRLKDQLVISQS